MNKTFSRKVLFALGLAAIQINVEAKSFFTHSIHTGIENRAKAFLQALVGLKPSLFPASDVAKTVVKIPVEMVEESLFIHESVLIKNKSPYAFAWITELTAKYPELHLEKIYFILDENKTQVISEECIAIYKKDVSRINDMYYRKSNGLPLLEKELGFLACQEWEILHAIGHIKKDTSLNLLKTLVVSAVGIYGLAKLMKHYALDTKLAEYVKPVVDVTKKDANDSFMKKFAKDTFAYLANPILAYLAYNIIADTAEAVVSQKQINKADTFACELADANVLKAAIKSFDEIDSVIKLEEKAKYGYIPSENEVGRLMQKLGQYLTFATPAQVAFIKNHASIRWLADMWNDYKKPQPSARAAKVAEYLAKAQAAK